MYGCLQLNEKLSQSCFCSTVVPVTTERENKTEKREQGSEKGQQQQKQMSHLVPTESQKLI